MTDNTFTNSTELEDFLRLAYISTAATAIMDAAMERARTWAGHPQQQRQAIRQAINLIMALPSETEDEANACRACVARLEVYA